MADVVQDQDTGQFFVRAGGNQLTEIPAELVPVAQETDVETFLNSLGNSVGQLGAGAGALMGVPSAREQYDQLQRTQAVRGAASPVAATTGALIPDVAAGGIAGIGAKTAGRAALRAGVTEAGLGAARNPDAPLIGAMIQGTAGALAGGLVAGSGIITRRFQNTADDVVARSRGRQAVDDGIQGPPSSISGAGPDVAAQQGQRGLLARATNWGPGDPPDMRTMADADRLGLRLTPADRSGNRVQKNVESTMKTAPSADAVFEERIMRPNQERLNAIVGRAAGFGEDMSAGINPRNLGENVDRIGAGFQEIAGEIGNTKLDTAKIRAQPNLALKGVQQPEVRDQLQRLINDVPKQVDGARGFEYVSRLREISAEAFQRGRVEFATGVDAMAEEVERQMLDTLTKAGKNQVAARLSDLREQWKVQRLLERGSVVTPEGDISMLAMQNALKNSKYTRSDFRRGGDTGSDPYNDMTDAVRVLAQFRERIGNSGTAARSVNPLDPRQWAGRTAAEMYLSGGITPGQVGRAGATGAGVAIAGDQILGE